jgi:hypothetical protein
MQSAAGGELFASTIRGLNLDDSSGQTVELDATGPTRMTIDKNT